MTTSEMPDTSRPIKHVGYVGLGIMGAPMAATELAERYFTMAADRGGGSLGTQAMSRALEQLGNFRFAP